MPTVLPEPLAPLSDGTGGAVDNIQPLCFTHDRGRAGKGSVHLCPTQEVDVPFPERGEDVEGDLIAEDPSGG